MLALALGACSTSPTPPPSTHPSASAIPSSSAPSPSSSPSPTAAPTATPTQSPIEAVLAGLTLDERIGQLLMPYAYGASATRVTAAEAAANRQIYGVDTPAQIVRRFHLGGVILLPRNTLHPTLSDVPTHNTTDPAAVPSLTDGLQQAAVADSGVPLLIATDQEEGIVTRIGAPLATFPGSMPLGATRDAGLARQVASATGAELASLGVNLDLAPDADVNVEPANPVIGLRSFGDDPAQVAAMVMAQVNGYREAAIGAAAKHFPGHGDTTVDSHTGLPVIRHDAATLDRVDLPPFQAAIDARVDVVMAGHLLVPALDPNQPATLSAPILTRLLRERLGFKGVVMTDSLWMQGIRSRVPSDAAASLRAFAAGADVLLMPPDPAASVAALRAAVAAGSISHERLDASVRRILALKQRLGLLEPGWRPAAAMPARAALSADGQLARSVARSAVTLVACRAGLPLRTAGAVVIGPARAAADLARDLGVPSIGVDFNPTAAQADAAVNAARGASGVVFLALDANASAGQRQLLARLAALAPPLIAVSIDLPYDLAVTSAADARAATFGSGPTSMAGLASALLAGRFGGRLPVAVPGAFRNGAGIDGCG